MNSFENILFDMFQLANLEFIYTGFAIPTVQFYLSSLAYSAIATYATIDRVDYRFSNK